MNGKGRVQGLERAGVPGSVMQEDRLPRFRKGPYRGDVSALCLVSSSPRYFLLAGTGPQVLVYDLISGKLFLSHCVFDGVRVHGIYSGPAIWEDKDSASLEGSLKTSTIAVYGERRVKLFTMLWQIGGESPRLQLLVSLPRFSYWIMDVRLVREERTTAPQESAIGAKALNLLAVGLSNNTISVWDLLNSTFIYYVACSERCLLYSMRLWGDSLATLRVGAGTVFNEVLVWKLGPNGSASRDVSCFCSELGSNASSTKEERGQNVAAEKVADDVSQLVILEEVVDPMQRIAGHEGSIHRLTWSSDGLSLVSVSDDRSARIWSTKGKNTSDDPWLTTVEAGPVLYGHGSRLWDCHFGDELLITASEDCTSRVWTAEGKLLTTLRGHVGRGIWRCIYDAELNILVTAGADSSIKVQSLDKWVARPSPACSDHDNDVIHGKQDLPCELQAFRISPSWSNAAGEEPSRFMDSKSEYVRCLALSNPWSLYVCTNQGAVYHVNLSRSEEASWTLLVDDLEGPIVCMDVLGQGMTRGDSLGSQHYFPHYEMVVVGSGRGRACAMQVRRTAEQWHCEWRHDWLAEKERQLLGVYWSKSTGGRSIFTTDPRGSWRLWHVVRGQVLHGGTTISSSSSPSLKYHSHGSQMNNDEDCIDLVAYGKGSHSRITCIDVCPELQLLVCGDKAGTLTVFLFPKDLPGWSSQIEKLAAKVETEVPIQLPVVAVFKGAHGISAIASVSVLPSKHGPQAEIISTGSDGCICRFLLDQHLPGATPQAFEGFHCTGVEKVAALSMVECLESRKGTFLHKEDERRIAVGFTGCDFLLWDLTHQCEVMRAMCGGWRRPHSVVVGDVPELQYCFVFVKDQVLQVQRNWLTASLGSPGLLLQEKPSVGSSFSNTVLKGSNVSLQGQFHGKEIYSVLYLHTASNSMAHESPLPSSWIATGSEDGGVLISRFAEEMGDQIDSTLILRNYTGGSAVRALALVAEYHIVNSSELSNPDEGLTAGKELFFKDSLQGGAKQQLLFSAGAKEVLTCWLLGWVAEGEGVSGNLSPLRIQETVLSKRRMLFSQWLSTRIPPRLHPHPRGIVLQEKMTTGAAKKQENLQTEQGISEEYTKETMSCASQRNKEDDQRYLALTAFATRCAMTGMLISFVVTASSNATLQLHAFNVTHCSWVELAALEYPTALVLTVEHLVSQFSIYVRGTCDVYMVITGAANGNIALWDVTNPVLEYSKVSILDVSWDPVAPSRPQTGRGSQGGRRRTKIKNLLDTSLKLKHSKEQAIGIDPLELVCESVDHRGGIVGSPAEGHGMSNCLVVSSPTEEKELNSRDSQFSKLFKAGSLRLNPLQELHAAHQSGINCMSVARIHRLENTTCNEMRMVYVVVSGGDDQALHMAIFTLEKNKSDLRSCSSVKDSTDVCQDAGKMDELRVDGTGGRKPSVLQCLSQSSVAGAHNSAVKGVWTDGLWAFSTGLDQRLKCWRVNVQVADFEHRAGVSKVHDSGDPKSASCLVECMTCIIDVPEAAALHVKDFHGGNYQIVVVGRGLQVIKVDTCSSSC